VYLKGKKGTELGEGGLYIATLAISTELRESKKCTKSGMPFKKDRRSEA